MSCPRLSGPPIGRMLFVYRIPDAGRRRDYLWGAATPTGGLAKERYWVLGKGRECALVWSRTAQRLAPRRGWSAGSLAAALMGYESVILVCPEGLETESPSLALSAPRGWGERWWVRYSGPWTAGEWRVSGRWGCEGDAEDFGRDDGGPGGRVVVVREMET